MAFEGDWDVSIASPMGVQKVRFAIRREAGALSGTATQNADVAPFQNIQAEANRLKWSQQVSRPFPMTVKFDVVVDGDGLTGTAKPGLFPPTPVTGVRVSA